MDALGNRTRREIVRHFERGDTGTAVPVEELVSHLEGALADEERGDLAVSVLHVHLPKLAAYGWLTVDGDAEHVTYLGHQSAGRRLRDLADVFTG